MPDVPAPLTPPDCDLRDFRYLRLDVVALAGSPLAGPVHPAAFRAHVLLACAAWHEVPAASVPDDDKYLAVASGAQRRWRRVRALVLAEWVKCADGRLYHPQIADLALRAWDRKQATARRMVRRVQLQSCEWASLRSATFAREGYRCVYCGSTGVPLEPDHIVPLAAGGPTELSNLATACRRCNRSKGAKSLEVWRRQVHA